MNGDNSKFIGKYRGIVVSNVDPDQRGRLLVQVPDVLGSDPCFWAMPSSPVAGTQMGMYAVPPINAGVWVEFEQGDPDYPIWTGCWRGSVAEVPALALAGSPTNPNIVLQTVGQNTILISGDPVSGITIKSATGAFILINEAGITISNGKGATIAMAGPTVAINGTALTIT